MVHFGCDLLSGSRSRSTASCPVGKADLSRAAGSIGGRAPIAFLPLADGPDVIKFDAGLWLFCSEVLQNGEGGKLR